MDYFNLHTHQYTDRTDVLELVNQYPMDFDEGIPFYSIGIHPLFINDTQINAELEIVNKKLALPACLALGECGLDKRSDTPFELQIAVFESQLKLAQIHHKPIVIHCVTAFQELVTIKKKLKISVPMVVHGFSKNEILAKQLIENGFYLSFGKHLLRNPALEPVFKKIPNDRFFLETDMIEERIEDVYNLAAQYKNMNLKELQQLVINNRKRLFGI